MYKRRAIPAKRPSDDAGSMTSAPNGKTPPLVTPDGRYIVVRGRLWRRADPALPEPERARWVKELMDARRAVAAARRTQGDEAEAHRRVEAAKVALGERGAVWWSDGAPDLNRHMARTTPYAAWFAAQEHPSDRSAATAAAADEADD